MGIIKFYIDKSLELANSYREYLMYVPFYERNVVTEMINNINLSEFSKSNDSVFITQDGKTDHNILKGTGKDTFWKSIENDITEKDIIDLEKRLNIILPESYKEYLKYKYFYEIFWDIEIILHAKPKNDWNKILIEINEKTKEIILDKGYFSIGRYSDYGIVALKLGDKNEELEVVMFDYETELSEHLANNFTELLENILKLEKAKIKELKNWQKKMKTFNR